LLILSNFIALNYARGRTQSSLGGCQLCDRNAIRGTTHIIQAYLVAENHRFRIASVLAANTQFKPFPGLSPLADRHPHQGSYAGFIKSDKRVFGKKTLGHVARQKPPSVIAREA
jgi:hypothetical protein